MRDLFDQVRVKSKIRVVIGIFLVLLGLIIHLIPLVPGSWVIFIGLEILGIRLMVQDKLKLLCGRTWWGRMVQRMFVKKDCNSGVK